MYRGVKARSVSWTLGWGLASERDNLQGHLDIDVVFEHAVCWVSVCNMSDY
jgi:hypothetical protein